MDAATRTGPSAAISELWQARTEIEEEKTEKRKRYIRTAKIVD